MNRARVGGVLAVAVALLAAPGPAAAEEWESAALPTDGRVVEARIAHSHGHAVTAVWLEYQPAAERYALLAARKPAGGDFGLPQLLYAHEYYPTWRLAQNGRGDVYVAWQEWEPNWRQLNVARQGAAGLFEPPTELGRGAGGVMLRVGPAGHVGVVHTLGFVQHLSVKAPGGQFRTERVPPGEEDPREISELGFDRHGNLLAVLAEGNPYSYQVPMRVGARRTVAGSWGPAHVLGRGNDVHRLWVDGDGRGVFEHSDGDTSTGESWKVLTFIRPDGSAGRTVRLLDGPDDRVAVSGDGNVFALAYPASDPEGNFRVSIGSTTSEELAAARPLPRGNGDYYARLGAGESGGIYAFVDRATNAVYASRVTREGTVGRAARLSAGSADPSDHTFVREVEGAAGGEAAVLWRVQPDRYFVAHTAGTGEEEVTDPDPGDEATRDRAPTGESGSASLEGGGAAPAAQTSGPPAPPAVGPRGAMVPTAAWRLPIRVRARCSCVTSLRLWVTAAGERRQLGARQRTLESGDVWSARFVLGRAARRIVRRAWARGTNPIVAGRAVVSAPGGKTSRPLRWNLVPPAQVADALRR